MVLRRNLQVHRWVRSLGELGIVCVPGALAHRHLATNNTLPVWVFHTYERGVVWWLVFTGRCGRGCGPRTGGAGWGEAMGSARVQPCYSHNLMGEEGGFWRWNTKVTWSIVKLCHPLGKQFCLLLFHSCVVSRFNSFLWYLAIHLRKLMQSATY